MFLLLACGPQGPPEPPPGPTARDVDVVLISVETWRADRLALGGHSRNTMPFVESIAAASTVYSHATSPAPWTLPSVASMMTGQWPHESGVVRTEDVLDARAETLAEAMSAKGYQTVFIGVNELFTHGRGLDRGYDVFEAHVGLSVDGVGKRVAEVAWDGRPRFLHLHLFEPHCPYWPPRSHRGLYPVADEPRVTDAMLAGTVDCHIVPDERRLGAWLANYDAELNALDGQLERLLRDWGHARWILVGDHGEAFWEHGVIGHGTELVPEVLRVPLIVREPSGAHAVVEEPVSTREVYRLVLQQPLLTDVLSETSQTAERQCLVTVGEPSLCAVEPRSTPTLTLDDERLRALEALGYTHLLPSPNLGED